MLPEATRSGGSNSFGQAIAVCENNTEESTMCGLSKQSILVDLVTLVLLLAGLDDSPLRADVPAILGGGNVGRDLPRAEMQLKALNTIGAGMCRIPTTVINPTGAMSPTSCLAPHVPVTANWCGA